MARPKKVRIPSEEFFHPGHYACQGCGAPIVGRYLLKALGKKTIIVIPACCWSVIQGPYPYSTLKVNVIHTAFETAASTAAGIRASLEMQKKNDVNVVALAGDGGTFDIGLQALSGAAERNDDIIYVCYDNEAYMNTGIQRSSSTPLGAWTTTTPGTHYKDRPKKDIIQIMAAHRIPYAATGNVAYPEDLYVKFKKATTMRGLRFFHILSPCPPGWRSSSEDSIKIARYATWSKMHPLYEVYDGEKYVVRKPEKEIPVNDYFSLQKRFAHLTEREVDTIQQMVDERWESLLRLAS
ncbi:MAG: pyruvate synthase subunit beta [Candidatus Schekmanbacteria bacterium]|nr:MAG: pyruvate synthase subunit beta [Candidatus Schekmanbacteria bacterium]